MPKWLKGLAIVFAIVGTALVVTAATVLTCGVGTLAGTLVGAVIYGAAQGIVIGAAVGTVGGGTVGGIVSDWSAEGILTGMGIGLGVGAIIGGIIGGFSGANSRYNTKALDFTNYGSNEVVLGKSPEYVNIARSRGATYFMQQMMYGMPQKP